MNPACQQLVDCLVELERGGALRWIGEVKGIGEGYVGVATDRDGALVMVTLHRHGDEIAGIVSRNGLLVPLPSELSKKLYPIHLEPGQAFPA